MSYIPPTNVIKPKNLIGVNLASGSFDPSAIPGVLGSDYEYATNAEIDYYASKGIKVFRQTFLWERFQVSQNGPIGGANGDLAIMDGLVNYAGNTYGIYTLLDPHNFGSGFGNLIGSVGTPTSSFTNFWGQLSAHYATNPWVIFSICNEPQTQTATQWLIISNAVIAAIRANEINIVHQINVTGTYSDSAASWLGNVSGTNDNAVVIGNGTVDPGNNVVYEIHCYADSDGSGTQAAAVDVNVWPQRLGVTRWARAKGVKLFLGEFGTSTSATDITALQNLYAYLSANADVWQGGTYWAGGPGWGAYIYTIEPTGSVGSYTDQPQMGPLIQHQLTNNVTGIAVPSSTINLINNSSNYGAYPGLLSANYASVGSLPMTWGYNGNDNVVTIIGSGIDTSTGVPLPYIDLNFAGVTFDGGAAIVINNVSYTTGGVGIAVGAVILPSTTYVLSAYMALIAGSFPASTGEILGVDTFNSSEGYIGSPIVNNFTMTGTLTRFSATGTTGAGAVWAAPKVIINGYAAPSTINYTIRIAGAQFEVGSSPTAFKITPE